MSEDDQHNLSEYGEMILPFFQQQQFQTSREPSSPPKSQVDNASLQQAMDKNKESLKVKLMTRRPINQLVDQGILPSLKVTPHFFHQRQKLERAKTGDFLKNKIQRRPDRQELIQQHILEDTTVDPSLHDKQRQLKKARLQDDLNDRLSHRPGPLELVKGNILQADEKFAQAVKEGQIQFKKTCEGQSLRHPPPSFVVEEDSSSDVALSPPQDSSEQTFNSLPSVDSMVASPYSSVASPYSSIDSPCSYIDPKSVLLSPTNTATPSPPSSQLSCIPQVEAAPSGPTVRIRKKSKPKSQPKPRIIKFHEYKGPPSALKIKTELLDSETSYELLLKQQQLFLQWQLEWQQKYPQIILPVTQKPQVDQNSNCGNLKDNSQDLVSITSPKGWSKLEDMKVSDLKAELKKRSLPVSGSKPQLIERLKPYTDFTISMGNKKVPSAVLDAKSVITTEAGTATLPINVGGIILDTLPTLAPKPEKPIASVVTMDTALNGSPVSLSGDGSVVVYNTVPMHAPLIVSRPSSVAPMDIESQTAGSMDSIDGSSDANSKIAMNENIVMMQQKRIQELQLELQRSQLQLQQQQWFQLQQQQQQQQQVQQRTLIASQPVTLGPATVNQLHQIPITSIANTLPQINNMDSNALKKLQQHFQQKLQQQQLLQQLNQSNNGNTIFPANSAAVSAAVKANLAQFIHNQQSANARLALMNQQHVAQLPNLQPVVICQSAAFTNEKPRANSLPNGVIQSRLIWTSSLPNFTAVLTTKPNEVGNAKLIAKIPVEHSEVAKQQTIKPKQSSTSNKQRSSRKSVKSQAVDDVLEILIKNGELPPSAAQVPSTPTTPENQKTGSAPPCFPTAATTPVQHLTTTTQLKNSLNHEIQNTMLPSTIVNEATSQSPLDFDFQLDLHDIEAMDLGSVIDNHPLEVKEPQPSMDSNHFLHQNNKSVDMDTEFSDWLDVMSNQPSSTTSANATPMFNCGTDPLLPNVELGRENFDMFSLDDMDFKTSDNPLTWDKVDFAT